MFLKLLCFCAFVISSVYSQSVLPCGSTTTAKTFTLQNPQNPISACAYTVRPLNNRICQLLIEFDTFVLAQPSIVTYPMCLEDSFMVGKLRLCGENNGQHFYISMNATSPTPENVGILVISQMNGVTARWKAKVTQLECPSGSPIFRENDDSTYLPNGRPKPMNDLILPGFMPRSTDGYWIAPVGCLQYFPGPNGFFQSLNYNYGKGPYPSDMNYAICFRRTSTTSQLRLEAFDFQIGLGAGDGFDGDCYGSLATIGRNEDFLLVPGEAQQGDLRYTRFCGKSLRTGAVTAKMLVGPIFLQFKTDKVYTAADELGFRISYSLS